MTLRVEWVASGTVRTFPKLAQKEVNRIINQISKLTNETPAGQVKITVE